MHLVLVDRNHRLAEHVDALGHAPRELPWHERERMLAVLHVGDLGPVEADERLPSAALHDDVLKSPGDDEAGLQPVAVEQGVEHRRAGVDRRLRIRAHVRPCVSSDSSQ